MKKRKVLYGILTALFLTTFSVPAMAQENMGNAPIISAEDHSSDPAIMEDGMLKEQNRISFYRHGSVVKNRWLNYKGSRYYFGADGYAYTGSHKIGKKVYVFDNQGKLLKNRKNKLVTVCGKKYYMATKAGNPTTGYFIYRNHLYYADSKGRCYQKRSREKGKYFFTEKGYAKKNIDTSLKIQALKTISRVTTSKMSKAQKLKACWNYLVDGKSFRYAGSDPNRKKKGWYKETALRMLETKSGNCYSFACAFAALAKELGYKNIKLHVGYDHCWVTINGKHYDPQAHFTIWITGIYGLDWHPLGNEVNVYTFA